MSGAQVSRIATHLRFPKYVICDDGTVTSIVHKRPRALKPIKRGKYLGFTLLDTASVLRPVYWHRLITETFHGAGQPGEEVRHKDGIKEHCWADNLHWGTRSQNMLDKNLHGTSPQGERHGCAKLTEREVRLIRRLCRAGIKQNAAAKYFKVSQMTISRVANGLLWRHISG
jgi:hypothetical protein